MSMIPRATSESSVTFSLAELARIEEERLRKEDALRAQAREREARERREAEQRRRAEEEARLAAETEARARRLRAEAEEKARNEARDKAAADVARIEAQARAKLEADNAQRAHELAILKVHAESGRRRLATALVAVIGLAIAGGGAAAVATTRHIAAIEQETERLREEQAALRRERDSAKSTELSSLDRRFAALLARPHASEAEDAKQAAEAARKAVDTKAPDHARMRAFGDALDALDARLDTLDKLAQLDRRHADLDAWAAAGKRTDGTAAVRAAATRAKAIGSDDALRAYEASLDHLRDTLAQAQGGRGGVRPATQENKGGECTPGDPGCSFDGHRIF
jgi:hypothetical protein